MKLDNAFITPYILPQNSLRKITRNDRNFFVKGEIYSLSGESCDGFTMPSQDYVLIDVVNSIDSVIMKRTTPNNAPIFSLTKNDCRKLEIEFDYGLQLFSQHLNWQRKQRNITIEFDANDLSTYPTELRDGRIHYIIIKLSGFSVKGVESHFCIETPNNYIFTNRNFAKNVKIKLLKDLECFNKNDYLNYDIITSSISSSEINQDEYNYNHLKNYIVDDQGCIYLQVSFENERSHCGINADSLKNLALNDVCEVRVEYTNEESIFEAMRWNWHREYMPDFLLELEANGYKNY